MSQDTVDPRDSDRTRAFLQISLTAGLGLRTAHRLLAEIENPEDILSLTVQDLAQRSVPPPLATELLSPDAKARAEREWNRARGLDLRLVDIHDPMYPPLLRETFDPPLVLYLRGKNWDSNQPHLAIIGARNASTYGLSCAHRLAREVASQGIVIVSGLARGIDTAAHRGALEGGYTVAVCGTGLDSVYPRENRELADSITSNGALLSEFPLATPPLAQNFPMRNRILAGMTLGTLVVEAAERSGSLITARLALEANREVFAVPGSILSPRSVGTHSLIRQGACLVTDWTDIVEELGSSVSHSAFPDQKSASIGTGELSHAQRSVRNALSVSEETPVDILLATLPLPAGEIYSALLGLELSGIVRQLPGDRYVLRP